MNVLRGDVVLIDYPFSVGGGVKVRPVLVVQNDRDNGRLLTTIVAQITGTTHRATTEATQLLIDLATPEGRQAGLQKSSAVNCANLFTVAQQDVLRRLGNLPPNLMLKVDVCLKAALELP